MTYRELALTYYNGDSETIVPDLAIVKDGRGSFLLEPEHFDNPDDFNALFRNRKRANESDPTQRAAPQTIDEPPKKDSKTENIELYNRWLDLELKLDACKREDEQAIRLERDHAQQLFEKF